MTLTRLRPEFRQPRHVHAHVELARALHAGKPCDQVGNRRVSAAALGKGLELGPVDMDVPAAGETVAPQIQVGIERGADCRRRAEIGAHAVRVA